MENQFRNHKALTPHPDYNVYAFYLIFAACMNEMGGDPAKGGPHRPQKITKESAD